MCFKCGGKWGPNHKCPAQIPLHVIEEILDALESEGDPNMEVPKEWEDEIVATVSQSADADCIRRTLRLYGRIGKLTVLILVDSGSIGTFISENLAAQLQMATTSCTPMQLVAADGSPMVCDQKISDLQWHVQGLTFLSSAGILALKCFDMILGANWLE